MIVFIKMDTTKLKSLKKQLKSRRVDWDDFEDRAKSTPQEINVRTLRRALQEQPLPPENVVKTLLQEWKKLNMRNLVDRNVLRYACCYNSLTSAEMMAMLLDNVDHNDTVEDFLDIIVADGGGHLRNQRYSVEALNEVLKRSKRKDILHVINSDYHYEFSFLGQDEFLYISTCIVQNNPSTLQYVDEHSGNIPLHRIVEAKSIGMMELFIFEGLKNLVFPSNERGGLMVKNSNGQTPLELYVSARCNNKRLDLLDRLFSDSILSIADVKETELLHHALQHKNENIARLLSGLFPDLTTMVSAKGNLPIHIATEKKMCLELVQLMIGEAVGLGLECGGLCVLNSQEEAGTSPIQNIVKSYSNTEVTELLEILLDAKLIKESEVVDKKLLPIALCAKSDDVAKLIIKQCPQSLGADCSGSPLHTACRNKNSADLILMMIETAHTAGIERRGGLVTCDGSGTIPLQLLASNPSDAINDVLTSLFDSDPALLQVNDIIDFNLLRFALCGLAARNYVLFYQKLPDELKALSLKTVDKDGRLNIHFALKNRHTNAVILNIIKESIRLCGTSGLFVKDNFGDMPIDCLLRTHYPQWNASYALMEELLEMKVISQKDVANHNLLHKVARWPRCQICRQKAELMLSKFPEAVLVADNTGDLPIHHITHHHKDWESIATMTNAFVRIGIKVGMGGSSSSVGGLILPSVSDGKSLLAWSILHEADKFRLANDPSSFHRMIHSLSKLLEPFPDSRLPFLQTVMNLMPPKILPELVVAFDDAAFVKDKNGRSLLNISSRKGLKWLDGLNRIFAVNMPGILEEDPLCGLPNFLLAAVHSENEANDTEAIFELLRNDSVRLVSFAER